MHTLCCMPCRMVNTDGAFLLTEKACAGAGLCVLAAPGGHRGRH